MKVEFLGTGGALTTPRPLCSCGVCVQARENGIPYSRTGPATFVHGPDVLIDTPEEIKEQLNRSRIRSIAACFYSHWHPDHVMGRRVWETINIDFRNWPPAPKRTRVYLPQQVAADFRVRVGSWQHLAFLVEQGTVELVELRDGEDVTLGDTTIRPFRLAEAYVYGFLFESAGRRLLLVPDELNGWSPPEFARGVDLAVIPMGVAEFDVLTGERRVNAEHPILKAEATFRETLEIVDELRATRVVMSHIEEMDGVSYDDLLVVEERLRAEGRNVSFAYDTLVVDV